MPSDRAARSRSALRDIAINIRLAQTFTGEATLEAFAADTRTFYAVVRCLEIVSEAARRIDGVVLARHPTVPWSAIRSAGNFYRHEYGDVDAELVLATVRVDLPPLLAIVEAELAGSAGQT